MELKGSRTEQNLMTAFAGESQARNKYTYYASKDGVRNVYHIYTVTYKETNVMFNCIMVYLYDGNDYYDELIDIITKVEYIGNVKGL